MRKFISALNEAADLEQQRLQAFRELADAQRGAPEMAMVDCQSALGGGVLSAMVEHIGDLTHRMSEHPEFLPYSGYEAVKPKIDKGVRVLTSPYGFEREHMENMRSNATFGGVPFKDHMRRVNSVLNRYAEEHAKLKVYNEAQKLARDAAVALGHQDWMAATRCMWKLEEMSKTPEQWHSHAAKFDPNFNE
jgi:hypothetical protein